MDLESQDIEIENLQQMPYTELRKLASKFGIGLKRMKADKLVLALISKISSTDNETEDCFSTPTAKLVNSSKKNKEKIFDENQTTPLVTPRRGTFTVETPSFVKAGDPFVTLENTESVLDESNVTFSRGSERKLRSRKVSFMSPTLTPRTPRSQSLRKRPKTPIATRMPLNEADVLNWNSVEPQKKSPNKSFLGSPETKVNKLTGESDAKSENVGKNFSSPLPSSVQESGKRTRLSRAKISPKNVGDEKVFSAVINNSTPLPAGGQKVEKIMSISKSKIALNNDKGNPNRRSAGKEPTSLKKKQTPNFKRIHQKAFDKMESIDDYQKRKMLNSAKKLAQHTMLKSKMTRTRSKIPAFSGIPFLGSLNSKSSANSKKNICMRIDDKKAPLKSKENVSQHAIHNRSVNKKQNLPKTPLLAKSKSKLDSETSLRMRATPISAKSKSKFDLKQSLSRKLNYKPHRGPLKPLSSANTTVHSTSILLPKEPVESKAVTKNRSQNRSLIRGVRMNKRFELQMKNRKLD